MARTHLAPDAIGNVVLRPIAKRILLLLLTILSMSQSVAQPKAVSPDDLSRIRQLSEFSNDWSETDAFDLEHYVTLQVTIESLQVPGHAGNVYLWFTLKNPRKLMDQEGVEPGQLFKATLQSVKMVQSLGIDEWDFPRGADAIIRGWTATDRNITGSQ